MPNSFSDAVQLKSVMFSLAKQQNNFVNLLSCCQLSNMFPSDVAIVYTSQPIDLGQGWLSDVSYIISDG